MEEVLWFFKNYEIIVYLVLGILAAWQVRKFVIAWQELQAAAFGLEYESAQGRLNRAAGILVLLLVVGVLEFGLVTFVVPAFPEVEPLPTDTLNLLATPTTTLQAVESISQEELAIEMTEQIPAAGCIPEEVMITFPENETTVRDIIEVRGTVNVPNLGFYKFEIASFGSDDWLTIQAGEDIVIDGVLGNWDTTQLEPGSYYLRLVVADNEGNHREPCVVSVYVEKPTEE